MGQTTVRRTFQGKPWAVREVNCPEKYTLGVWDWSPLNLLLGTRTFKIHLWLSSVSIHGFVLRLCLSKRSLIFLVLGALIPDICVALYVKKHTLHRLHSSFLAFPWLWTKVLKTVSGPS